MLNRPLSTNGDDYIINGEDAAPHSRPYQISYQQKTFTGWLVDLVHWIWGLKMFR